MPKILVVYENVPEETFIAVLEMNPEEWELHKPLAGQMVNTTECTLSEQQIGLSVLLEKRCRHAQRARDDKSGIGVDGVLYTGFFL